MSFIQITINGRPVKLSRETQDNATERWSYFFDKLTMSKPFPLWRRNGLVQAGHAIPAYLDGWTDADVEARINAAVVDGTFASYLK